MTIIMSGKNRKKFLMSLYSESKSKVVRSHPVTDTTIDHFSTVVLVEKPLLKPVEMLRVTSDGLDWFSPSTINKALTILRKQNPHVAGLQCICSSGDHFIPKHSEFLQILRKKDRYVLVSTYRKKNGNVDFYDPMINNGKICVVSSCTQNRIANLTIHNNIYPKLYINVAQTDHNFGFDDSGVLCIALVLLIIKGITPDRHLLYDADKIKTHMKSCMEDEFFSLWFGAEDLILLTRFPFRPSKFCQEKTPAVFERVEIDMYCLCHRPKDDLMVSCEKCHKLFHPVCVMKFGFVKMSRRSSTPKLLCPDCNQSTRALGPNSRVPSGIRSVQYDAYIAYSSCDLWFVKNVLIPNLEHNSGNVNYKLMISERDFIPGRDIVDEMIRGVSQSRTCLVVGTTNYFNGHLKWFEWNQIVMYKWYSTKILLVDSFDDVMNTSPARSFNESLNQRNFYEWKVDLNERAYLEFWNQLKQYLGRPSSLARCSGSTRPYGRLPEL